MELNQIIRNCLDGKEGAWKMLVDAYSKRVFNMAYQFSGSYEEAEDLTQDIFIKLYNSLTKYDFSKNFSAWLLTMSKNYLIDQYRRTKWEKKTRDEFDEYKLASPDKESPEHSFAQEESKKLVWQGFNQLSADIRMAVILRDIQGKRYDEIAEILDIPLGTIKSRVNRGRLQLAKVLKENKEKGEINGV